MNILPADQELLCTLRLERLDTVDGVFAYEGGEDLVKDNLHHRRRTRLTLPGDAGTAREFYLKRYGRERLGSRLRRWLTYGLSRSPARVEYDSIAAVRAAGVPTMEAVACGQESHLASELFHPSASRSYIIVSAVPGDALSRCGEEFLRRHADKPETLREFTRRLASMTAALHAAGIVHRDLYAAHVFLHEHDGQFDLYLIDLARAFRPRWRMTRWRVKDLAQLKYSMPPAWVERWWDEFLRAYMPSAGAEKTATMARMIDAKVARMKRRKKETTVPYSAP